MKKLFFTVEPTDSPGEFGAVYIHYEEGNENDKEHIDSAHGPYTLSNVPKGMPEYIAGFSEIAGNDYVEKLLEEVICLALQFGKDSEKALVFSEQGQETYEWLTSNPAHKRELDLLIESLRSRSHKVRDEVKLPAPVAAGAP